MLADGSTGNIPPEWELFGTQFIREIGVDSGGISNNNVQY